MDYFNPMFIQLTRLDPYLWGIRCDLTTVLSTPKIRDLRKLAEQRAALPANKGMIEELKESGAWRDLGKLKQALTKDLCCERDCYLRELPEWETMQ